MVDKVRRNFADIIFGIVEEEVEVVVGEGDDVEEDERRNDVRDG